MGRWEQLAKVKKIMIIVLIGLVVNAFIVGYNIGYNVEQNRLKNLVSDNLMVSKDAIEKVKIGKDRVDIHISTLKNSVSTKDRTIFEYIDPEYVVDMKYKFINKDIYLH